MTEGAYAACMRQLGQPMKLGTQAHDKTQIGH